MTNSNVDLNSCSSAVNFTLGCGALGYLVITAQTAMFSTHYGAPFLLLTNPGIHLVIPDPAPTAAILAELIRNHKHEVWIFKNITWSIRRTRESSIS